MSDPTSPAEEPPRPRGEAAWKQHLDDVARRNAEVSKTARAEREPAERARMAKRNRLEGRDAAPHGSEEPS